MARAYIRECVRGQHVITMELALLQHFFPFTWRVLRSQVLTPFIAVIYLCTVRKSPKQRTAAQLWRTAKRGLFALFAHRSRVVKFV
jgi:hypothetical protein